MKFGCLYSDYQYMPYWWYPEGRYANLGDYVQYQGVIELYEQIGIPKADIVRINIYDLPFYEGEDILVPMNNFFYDEYCTMFPPSPNIHPIFFGFHVSPPEISRIFDYVDYFKLFEPIGCRDYATCETLRRRGVDAYVSGCASLALPTRPDGDYETVFLVDVRPDLLKYIPPALAEKAVRVNHLELLREYPPDPAEIRRLEEMSQAVYSRYANEAALVITSRLHAAVPCAGMGIPVALTSGSATSPDDTHRYSWAYELLPVFRAEDLARLRLPFDTASSSAIEYDAAIRERKIKMKADFSAAVGRAMDQYNRGEFVKLRPNLLEAQRRFLVSFREDVFKVLRQTYEFRKAMDDALAQKVAVDAAVQKTTADSGSLISLCKKILKRVVR